MPLEEVATIITGVLPQEKKGCELISYTAVLPNQLTTAGIAGDFGIVRRDSPCADEQFLNDGDVLIKRLNHDCSVIFTGSKSPIVPSANLFAIRPGHGLDSQYLACMLEHSDLIKQVSQLSGIGTTVAAITAKKLGAGIIMIPPLEVQQNIGAVWALTKKREILLRDFITENDRMLTAFIGNINKLK